MEKTCEHCIKNSISKKAWYKENLYVVSLLLTVLLILSYFIKFLNPLLGAFFSYVKLIWWAIILGLLLGGIIDYFVPKEYIYKYLGQRKKKTIFIAVLLGFLMTACSHGILAIAIELYKKGAATSSIIAFLLASPWANIPVTIILFGFFGVKALFFVLSAIIIAIVTGLIYQILEDKGMVETHKRSSIVKDNKKKINKQNFNLNNAIKGVAGGSWSLAKMVLWWILIGMFLASAAGAFIPQHFFMNYMGPTFLGLLVTLGLATIIEVCSEGSSPMAFEIFRQTGSFGNPFVFLMAGVATDYTEIGLIWHNIGRKAAIWLPIITVPQILIIGYLFNVLL